MCSSDAEPAQHAACAAVVLRPAGYSFHAHATVQTVIVQSATSNALVQIGYSLAAKGSIEIW